MQQSGARQKSERVRACEWRSKGASLVRQCLGTAVQGGTRVGARARVFLSARVKGRFGMRGSFGTEEVPGETETHLRHNSDTAQCTYAGRWPPASTPIRWWYHTSLSVTIRAPHRRWWQWSHSLGPARIGTWSNPGNRDASAVYEWVTRLQCTIK